MELVTRVSLAGLVLIVLGLLVVIVHALNMSHLHGVDFLLPELGIVLIGIAVQILGLALILLSRK